MRYALLLLALVGCQKSADQKQRDLDDCALHYPTSQLSKCLTVEHGWKNADAFTAQMAQENKEAR